MGFAVREEKRLGLRGRSLPHVSAACNPFENKDSESPQRKRSTFSPDRVGVQSSAPGHLLSLRAEST